MTFAFQGELEIDPVDRERCWQVVLSRDTSMDGTFVYAVRSTRVYCRPSCPSRRPQERQVLFFAGCAEAEAAGFRPCRRCRPREAAFDRRPELVRQVFRYLDAGPDPDPSLRPLGQRLGVQAEYLRRLVRRTVGVTPRQYLEAWRVERLKGGLRDGLSVTRALYDAGYPSSNRLYESSPARLGMTPGAYRRGGRGMSIRYGVYSCPLGMLLVAATERGVCAVQLGDSEEQLAESLRREYPAADVSRWEGGPLQWVRPILEYLDGHRVRLDLPLDVQATAFQLRVWRALQSVAYGKTRTYSRIARDIGQPGAARAVGGACGANPVALIVPCHRAVRGDGAPGGYRWGAARKQALLAREGQVGPAKGGAAATR